MSIFSVWIKNKSRRVIDFVAVKEGLMVRHMRCYCHREDGGTVIDEVGWSEPLVIVRYGTKWDVYDTTTNKQISICDSERKENPKFRDIPSFVPALAWKKLWHYRNQW